MDLPWRTGAGPASVRCYKHQADSDPVVVYCGTPTEIWKQMMKYCELHWLFLASLHVGDGVCASGKLALTYISIRSMSGPSSAVQAVVPPRDFVGSWGCEIRALDFSQSL